MYVNIEYENDGEITSELSHRETVGDLFRAVQLLEIAGEIMERGLKLTKLEVTWD